MNNDTIIFKLLEDQVKSTTLSLDPEALVNALHELITLDTDEAGITDLCDRLTHNLCDLTELYSTGPNSNIHIYTRIENILGDYTINPVRVEAKQWITYFRICYLCMSKFNILPPKMPMCIPEQIQESVIQYITEDKGLPERLLRISESGFITIINMIARSPLPFVNNQPYLEHFLSNTDAQKDVTTVLELVEVLTKQELKQVAAMMVIGGRDNIFKATLDNVLNLVNQEEIQEPHPVSDISAAFYKQLNDMPARTKDERPACHAFENELFEDRAPKHEEPEEDFWDSGKTYTSTATLNDRFSAMGEVTGSGIVFEEDGRSFTVDVDSYYPINHGEEKIYCDLLIDGEVVFTGSGKVSVSNVGNLVTFTTPTVINANVDSYIVYVNELIKDVPKRIGLDAAKPLNVLGLPESFASRILNTTNQGSLLQVFIMPELYIKLGSVTKVSYELEPATGKGNKRVGTLTSKASQVGAKGGFILESQPRMVNEFPSNSQGYSGSITIVSGCGTFKVNVFNI